MPDIRAGTTSPGRKLPTASLLQCDAFGTSSHSDPHSEHVALAAPMRPPSLMCQLMQCCRRLDESRSSVRATAGNAACAVASPDLDYQGTSTSLLSRRLAPQKKTQLFSDETTQSNTRQSSMIYANREIFVLPKEGIAFWNFPARPTHPNTPGSSAAASAFPSPREGPLQALHTNDVRKLREVSKYIALELVSSRKRGGLRPTIASGQVGVSRPCGQLPSQSRCVSGGMRGGGELGTLLGHEKAELVFLCRMPFSNVSLVLAAGGGVCRAQSPGGSSSDWGPDRKCCVALPAPPHL